MRLDTPVFRCGDCGAMRGGEDALKAARARRVSPRHIVSDGDRAIERTIGMAYDKDPPRQMCQFHPLRERKRNIGGVGFSEAKALLGSDMDVP